MGPHRDTHRLPLSEGMAVAYSNSTSLCCSDLRDIHELEEGSLWLVSSVAL